VNPVALVYPETPIDEALKIYTGHGMRVFLTHGIAVDGRCTCGNSACKSPGKHPIAQAFPNGVKDATNDLPTLITLLGRFPNANLALATGEVSGVWVLDIDGDAGGFESMEELEIKHGNLPGTLVVVTGGGLHGYFRYQSGLDIRSKAGIIGKGIDQRANGGYVIIPPSHHVSGKQYTWAWLACDGDDPEIKPTRPAIAPHWLTMAALTKPQVSRESFPKMVPKSHSHREWESFSRESSSDGTIVTGQRNNELAHKAGYMRRVGFTESEILAALLKLNADRCSPALDADEVEKIAHSIASYSPAPKMDPKNPFRPIAINGGRVA